MFIRTSRSKRLTHAGKRFLEHVPRIFIALQQARDSVKAAANGFHGQLRIALSDGITPSRLPTSLALFRQEEPEVELRFFEVPLSQQIKGLHDDLYDVGFAQSDEVGDGIAVESAWSDPLMVAAPARHSLLKHKRIPLVEVSRYPLVPAGFALGLAGAPHIASRRESGAVIAGALVTDIKSDLPGDVIATLTSPPGLTVRIIVNRDLVPRTYQPVIFNRGASQ